MSYPIKIFREYRAGSWPGPLDLRWLKMALSRMLKAANDLGAAIKVLELYLVDDATISQYNMEYLHCFGPTNIISFPSTTPMPATLVLSLDALERECVLYGQDPIQHLIRLLAHGFGHLAGLGHGPEMDRVSDACAGAAFGQQF